MNVDDVRGPQEGDLSICIYCGALSFYCKDLTLRRLTPAEEDEVMNGSDGQRMQFIQTRIREMRHRARD